MMIINFMEKEFQCQIKDETLDLDKRKIKHITRVYENSPAEMFGIRRGDWLGDVNGVAPIDVVLNDICDPDSEIHYMIYRPEESKVYLIRGNALPLGIEVEYSTEAIVKRCEEEDIENELELYTLWQRCDWSSLSYTSRCCRGQDDLLFRLLAKVFKRFQYRGPAILTHGIALFELGKKAEGLGLIEHYYREDMQSWTTEWFALTYFYLGINEHEKGNAEGANELFNASVEYCRCPVLQSRLSQFGIQFSLTPYWNDQQFPEDFFVTDFSGGQGYQLSKLLNSLQDRQLLYLCIMPEYRANVVYDDFLLKYDKILSCFPLYTSPLYVITNIKEASEHQQWWQQNEKRLLLEGKPINLLFDANSVVAEALEQSTSPNIYVLNKDGVILSGGIDFSIEGIWPLLQKAFGNTLTWQDQ